MGASKLSLGTGWLCLLGLPLFFACSDEDATCSYLYDIVDFTFEPALTNPGDYTVSLTSPPVNGTCDVNVGSTSLPPCTNARMQILEQTDEGIVLLSGLHVVFDHAPPSLELTVESETETLVSQQYEPAYITESPNGRDCDSRRRASVTVELP